MSLPGRALTATALQELEWCGITTEEWARWCGWEDGVWHGDRCGCSDDRCITFHHETERDCQCLPTMLVWHARGERP